MRDANWRTRDRARHLFCRRDRPERGSGIQESRRTRASSAPFLPFRACPRGPAWCAAQAPEGRIPDQGGPGCVRGRGLLRRAADAAEAGRSHGRAAARPYLPSWVGSALPRCPICPAGPCRRRGKKSRTGGSPSLPSWVGLALPRGPICSASSAHRSPRVGKQSPTSSGAPSGTIPHTDSTTRPI